MILETQVEVRYLISHMWQELKAHWWAKDLIVHIHDLVLIIAWVQVVYSVLDDVQTLMTGGLQVILSRQVRPKCPCQASVISEVTALLKA